MKKNKGSAASFFKNYVVDIKYLIGNISAALAWLMSLYGILTWLVPKDSALVDKIGSKVYGILTTAWIYFALSILYGLVKQIGYSSFTNHFTGISRSVSMKFRLGDIFDNPNAAVVVPVNNSFETRLDYIVKRSIHGQVVSGAATGTGSNEEEIIRQLREQGFREGEIYDFGTVAKIVLPVGAQNGKKEKTRTFYFLASSYLSGPESPITTLPDVYKSIDGLFDYMCRHSSGDVRALAIPVIGAGAAGSHWETETLKYMMKTYSDKVFLRKSAPGEHWLSFQQLIICVRQHLYSDGIIDLKELRRYSEFVCTHADPAIAVYNSGKAGSAK